MAWAFGAAMCGGSAYGQQWINAGTGSWFNAANWNPATVPVAGGNVLISNGGTATLTGIAATPLLGSLTIGTAAQGNGRGTVQSVGTAILVSGGLEVGTLFSGGSFAQGALSISGAGGQAGQLDIGTMSSNTVAASVSGQVSSAGAFTINNGIVAVGQMFDAARGSTADGSVSIGGNAGAVSGLWVVGNVSTSDSVQVGSQSTGAFNVLNGGNLTLTGGTGTFIGTTVGVDRVADAGAPGGFRVSQAQGHVNITGTLSVTGPQGFTGIGQTSGGIVDGSLTVGTLAMGANTFNSLSIASSGLGGQAQGSFSAGSGDLRNAGFTAVGTTNGGTAQGSVALGGGGKLLGNNTGGLSVGTGSGSAGELVAATGSVNAAGGVAGFTGYSVGTLSGTLASGSFAQGTLIGGAAAGASSTSFITVGLLNSTTGAASASGTMTVGNALTVSSNIIVGDMFLAGRGSTADGSLSIGGNAGTINGIWIVGNVTTGDPAQIGSQSTGSFSVLNGGNLALAGGSGTFIGTTVGVDRVADAGAPGGFRVSQAQGHVNITGTLSVTGSPGFTGIGVTQGGIVDGSLAVGTLAMGANSFSSLSIGTSGAGGQAQGSFSAGGGTLRVGTLLVGNTTGGTASGELALNDAALVADQVLAGIGAGASAQLSFADASADVLGDLTLLSGELSLQRSLVTVGDLLTFGEDANLRVGIDGLVRGTEYGAIDAVHAILAGMLTADFSTLVFAADTMVFDLIRSGSADGISGDFGTLAFIGLAPGYVATAGVELDSVEIYRLHLARTSVPEPATFVLLAIALGGLAFSRRKR